MYTISTQHSNQLPHWLQPQVTKKQVDNFREGKLTPCCQLLAEFESTGKKKKIPTLKHRVNLKGAKYPNDVLVINLPAGGSYVHFILATIHVILYVHHNTDTSLQERSQTFGDLAAAAGMVQQLY